VRAHLTLVEPAEALELIGLKAGDVAVGFQMKLLERLIREEVALSTTDELVPLIMLAERSALVITLS